MGRDGLGWERARGRPSLRAALNAGPGRAPPAQPLCQLRRSATGPFRGRCAPPGSPRNASGQPGRVRAALHRQPEPEPEPGVRPCPAPPAETAVPPPRSARCPAAAPQPPPPPSWRNAASPSPAGERGGAPARPAAFSSFPALFGSIPAGEGACGSLCPATRGKRAVPLRSTVAWRGVETPAALTFLPSGCFPTEFVSIGALLWSLVVSGDFKNASRRLKTFLMVSIYLYFGELLVPAGSRKSHFLSRF